MTLKKKRRGEKNYVRTHHGGQLSFHLSDASLVRGRRWPGVGPCEWYIPLDHLTICHGKLPIGRSFTQLTLPFSLAMLNFQRVVSCKFGATLQYSNIATKKKRLSSMIFPAANFHLQGFLLAVLGFQRVIPLITINHHGSPLITIDHY